MLQQQGIEIAMPRPGEVLVDGETLPLFVRQNSPSPSELAKAVGIYVLPTISTGLRRLAAENPQLTLSAVQTGEIWHRGKRIDASTPARLPLSLGKVNWVRYGLLRAFAASSKPKSQTELAHELGITQGAVSQNLANLKQLLVRDKSGWRARSFEMVSREFLEHYPGPGGVEQSWFGLDAVIPQGKKVLQANPEVLLSADSAADEIAPYRRARTSMVYSLASLKLEELGFVRSERSKATLIEIIPADRTIFPLAQATSSKPLVDGLTAVFDLRRSAGTDAKDAADELLAELELSWSQDAK
jgi:hypothetical protein